MIVKVCTKCGEEKNISEFPKNKKSKDGVYSYCKVCVIEKSKKYKEKYPEKLKEVKKQEYYRNIEKYKISSKNYQKKHKEEIKIKKRKYYEIKKEEFSDKHKKYYENNKEIINKRKSEYIKKNEEKTKNYQKKYVKENREKINKYKREYNMKKYYNYPICRIQRTIRHRVNEFFKSNNINKNNKTMTIVGCTPTELKYHLEKQFTEGMSWENYGYYGWHIDHIKPLSSANTIEEIKILCHFTNLQPLWWNENLKKSNKIV